MELGEKIRMIDTLSPEEVRFAVTFLGFVVEQCDEQQVDYVKACEYLSRVIGKMPSHFRDDHSCLVRTSRWLIDDLARSRSCHSRIPRSSCT